MRDFVLRLALAAGIAVSSSVASAEAPPLPSDGFQSWSAPQDGLQIAIAAVSPTVAEMADTEFRVALRNVGNANRSLNLGIVLANGRQAYPMSFVLLLRDSGGELRRLQMAMPPVAGRVDDDVLNLHAGATYIQTLKLSQLWCKETADIRLKLAPGNYRVAVEFKGLTASWKNTDMNLTHWAFWIGALRSPEAAFTVTSGK